MTNTPPSKDDLIKAISAASNAYGDMLLLFLQRYNLRGLHDADYVDLYEFIKTEKIEMR